jgi:Ribonuclease G/E
MKTLKEFQEKCFESLEEELFLKECPRCNGIGYIKELRELDVDEIGDASAITWSDCENCEGTGYIFRANNSTEIELIAKMQALLEEIYTDIKQDANSEIPIVELLYYLFSYAEFKDINIQEILEKMV